MVTIAGSYWPFSSPLFLIFVSWAERQNLLVIVLQHLTASNTVKVNYFIMFYYVEFASQYILEGDIDLASNNKSLDLVSLSHGWREMHVNRNSCDGGWHTCMSLFLFVRKDIRCQSPPFQRLWKPVTWHYIFNLHLSTEALPPPARTSQQSFGKLQLWNQSFLRLSEKRSKGREHLFLARRVILHSYTCHRGNKSNICIIRWKLRVRKAGRWGLESSHLSCAVSLYQLILDTWTDLCNF